MLKWLENIHKRILFTGTMLVTSLIASAQQDYYDQLPDLGSQAANYLGEYEAAKLGKAFIRQSRYQTDYIYDPELVAYINDLGNELLAASRHADKQYHFYLIDNNVINAFAVPGGHIALHSAILTKSETESGLASVIAHEISHVTQRHIARKLESSRFDSILALGALLAAAAAGGGDAAQAAFSVANAGILDRQLRYSRSYEAEADSLGLRLMSKAGFDPAAMPIFFKRLLDESRLNQSYAPEFLRSHPLTINRIAETGQRVKQYATPPERDQSRFKLMQAKATASFSSNLENTRDLFKNQIEAGDNSLATHYGYALALSENNQFDLAATEFDQLAKTYPDNITIALSRADNELERENIEIGLKQLETLFNRERARGNYLIDIYYANALVLTDQNETAIPIIRSAIANSNAEPYLHILLSRAYSETGETMRSYQSRAEYHYLQGNYEFALRQLKRALDFAKTDYDIARLEARVDDVDFEIAELRKL
ncbi:MAG: M48 family metalloprotease [Pseudomonadota bacterium]